jgi:hypothetical protein
MREYRAWHQRRHGGSPARPAIPRRPRGVASGCEAEAIPAEILAESLAAERTRQSRVLAADTSAAITASVAEEAQREAEVARRRAHNDRLILRDNTVEYDQLGTGKWVRLDTRLTNPNGACLFETLSYGIPGAGPVSMRKILTSQAVRKAQANHDFGLKLLREHAASVGAGELAWFSDPRAYDEALGLYVQRMSDPQRGLWGGEAEIEAFTDLYKRPVVLLQGQEGQEGVSQVRDVYGREHSARGVRPIYAKYSPTGNHYDIAVNVDAL